MKVSVALCTYNGEKYLKKQLDSILNQSYKIDEIIIVDDCSNDSTRDILLDYSSKHSNIKLYFNETNLRANLAFKKAISLTNNELVAICDQDDVWHLDKIETQINLLRDQNVDLSEPVLVFHDLTLIDKEDNIINKSFWNVMKFNVKKHTFKDLFLRNIVTGCTCLINDKLKEQLLKLDFNNMVMYDHFIALITYGFGKAFFIEKPLMLYRDHSSSVTLKYKTSIYKRIIDYKFEDNRQNMIPNINQVIYFKKMYRNLLNNNKLKQLDQFIALKNKSYLSKLFYKFFIAKQLF